jgi:hypothetical protein
MRTTVGPHSPAVYWRRRLVVLGAVLLVVLIWAFSCSGGDDPSKPSGTGATGTVPTPGVQGSGAAAEPSFAESGPVRQPPVVAPTPTDVPVGAGPSVAAPPADGSCAVAEMVFVPVPSKTSAKSGDPIDLRLKIKNVSTRTCSRDVGADVQEIYVKQGAKKIWSSDVCAATKGSAVRQFPPNGEQEFYVTWNGNDSSRCEGGAATGPRPAAGEYELMGRLGAKVSDPVRLSLTS